MTTVKLYIRRSIILILYLLGRFFYKSNFKKNAGKTRIIVFHHIDSNEKFDRIINRLSNKYNIISFEDWVNSNISSVSINLIISMDDGYLSWYDKAFPVFIKYNVKPLMFLSTNLIDLNADDSYHFCESKIYTWPEKSLSTNQINEFIESGFFLGSHGNEHLNAIKTSSLYFERDLLSSNKILYDKFKFTNKFFAYPFGLYKESLFPILTKNKIHYAFTCDSGFIDDSPSNYELKRTNVGMRSPLLCSAFVEGYFEYYLKIVHFIRSFKF